MDSLEGERLNVEDLKEEQEELRKTIKEKVKGTCKTKEKTVHFGRPFMAA